MTKSNLRDLCIFLAIIIPFLIVFFGALTYFGVIDWNNESQYALTTVVSKLDTENDAVVCYDSTGNSWVFHGIEDWEIGDICSMLMNDKGTPEIYDDEIVATRYGGHLVGLIL